ncbi:class I SAM-dependent methyltransferase [Micromonospora maris]|uniref:class I SAM-dependent methyltransferase n=1 Tax=Micromonospora maris TaxID=1003110 RepID=UPI002E0EDE33|nr:class I SAM-dependent methyltransferase [Micromonospora maris]
MTTTPLPAHTVPPLLDPIFLTDLDRLDIRTNQRILEIGAGTGNITAHLAQLVGRYGSVTAVDADTSRLTPTSVIDLALRDLDREMLPGKLDSYDHIIARWPHPLRDPIDVVEQMIARLRPGGWLVLADFTPTPPRIHRAPDNEDATLIHAVMQQLHTTITNRDGGTWTADPETLLLNNGMVQYCVHTTTETWTGGGPGGRLVTGVVTHRRPHLTGITDADADRFAALMADPTVLLSSYERRFIHARKGN